MVRRSLVVALSVLFLLGGLVTSRAGVSAQDATPAGEPIKVGFVYVGPVGDLGWTYAHDQGRLALEEALPNVETGYQENVPENPADAERVIRQFAQDGYDVIFTTSFGYMDPTINVAKDFPDTTFIHISGFKTADNVGTGFGKIEEPRFVSGQLAGAMTESNQIGYVAAFPIPEVIRGINAFTLGVREVNPEATVRVVWTNTWFDPAKERAAAEALLDGGADVIAQHQDTAGPQQAAEDRGLYGVGYNADMAPLAPEAVLTSAIWNWGPYYIDIVERSWTAPGNQSSTGAAGRTASSTWPRSPSSSRKRSARRPRKRSPASRAARRRSTRSSPARSRTRPARSACPKARP